MKQAVIFDMDGTIADTLQSIAGFANAALADRGLPPIDAAHYRQLVGNGADTLMRRMLNTVGAPTTAADVAALRQTYDMRYAADPARLVTPYPGILDLLSALRARGVKAAVLSNKPDDMTNAIAAQLFPDLFEIVCGQRDGVPKKPNPTAALEIAAALGVPPADCLYVGDSGVDMQTGKNAGMETAGVLWGFREEAELRENGAAHLVDSAEALLKLIL